MSIQKQTIKKPNYGVIQISKVDGHGKEFYGSNIEHSSFFQFTVSTSTLVRDDTSDRFLQEDILLRFQMTPLQFTEMITNCTNGVCIPCSLLYANGIMIEQEETQTRKEFVLESFQNEVQKIQKELSNGKGEIDDLLDASTKRRLTKEESEKVKSFYSRKETTLISYSSYILEKFKESVYKMISDAAATTESKIIGRLIKLGLDKLINHNQIDKK